MDKKLVGMAVFGGLGWKIKEELPARITAAICFMPLRDPKLFKAMGP